MSTTVTLDNRFTLAQPYVDSDGITWWHRSATGWRDGVPMRTNWIDRQTAPGAYDAPAYPDKRVIVLNGTVKAASHTARLQAMRKLGAIAADGSMISLRVADELGELEAMVRRSDKPTFTMTGSYWFDYSLQFTAPEPRLLDVVTRSISTQMAQSGTGGIQWNGPNAANALSNPGFESGTSPWTATNCALAQSSTQLHGGTFSGRVTPNGSSASGFIESEKIAVTPGALVSVSAWVWFTNAVTTNYSTSVRWYNASNTLLSTSSATVSVSATTWTQVSNSFTAPANAAWATITPTLSGTPAAGQVWYVDDASLRVITGAQWRGPAGTTGLQWGQPNSTGVVSLDNTAGTANADVIATITGPAQRPAISTGADWIIYNGNIGSSDVLIINTGTGSVLLNGVNRRSYLTQADWFTIPAGKKLDVRFAADVQNSIASMTASWRVSYV